MAKRKRKKDRAMEPGVVIPEAGRRWPLLLLLLYIVEMIALGIQPYQRTVWLAENLTALIPVMILAVMYWRGIRFSNTAYTLMAIFFLTHTVGGHYTFERVPVMPVMQALGLARNHFDRVCHFMVGFFAFAALEYCDRRRLIRTHAAAAVLVIMSVFGFAAVFELIEWIYAELADPEAGGAFLGSQGDIWDAQKDMLADGLGAIAAVILYGMLRWPAEGASQMDCSSRRNWRGKKGSEY